MDVFTVRRRIFWVAGCGAMAAGLFAGASGVSSAVPPPVAYSSVSPPRIVADTGGDVVVIDPATGKLLSARPSPVGQNPVLLVATPDGKTVYLIEEMSDKVVPYSVATGRPGVPIRVVKQPAIALLAPDGTLYVGGDGAVTPVSTATNRAGAPIDVHGYAISIAITPDGRTVYVANSNGFVVPISTAANTAGTPIRVGSPGADYGDDSLAVTPDGKTVYVADASGAIIPISTATGRKGNPFEVSGTPEGIAITPSGAKAYVLRGGSLSAVSPLNLATHAVEKSIPIPGNADSITMSPDGKTAYVGYAGGPVIPISTATNAKGTFFGWSQLTTTMAFGKTVYIGTFNGTIYPVSTATYALGAPLYHPARFGTCWALVVTP